MTKMVWAKAMDPRSAHWKNFQRKWFLTELWPFNCPIWALMKCVKAGHLNEIHTSPSVELTYELMGYEPKASPKKSCVAAVMMSLARVGPNNSSTIAPGHRRRTLWTCLPSTTGSSDDMIGWLSGPWRQLQWFSVAGAMVCGVQYVLHPKYYDNLRAIAWNADFRAYVFQPLGRTSNCGCLIKAQDYPLPLPTTSHIKL